MSKCRVEVSHPRCGHPRCGLTLLELMMVLVILAIVSTVAIQSLQPQVDNQRFQSATKLLSQIESATVGPKQKYQVDGTPLISGFVSDIGRLPVLAPGAAAPSRFSQNNTIAAEQQSLGLSELWDVESELADSFPFEFRPGPKQPADYSDVRLACGWRGPYLHLAAGANSLKDPWGKAPIYSVGPGGQTTLVEIEIPTNSVDAEPQILTTSLTTGKVQVTGTIIVADRDKAKVTVVALVPDPQSSLTSLVILDDEDDQVDSFLFSDIPVGLRAIVADIDGCRHVKYIQVPHEGLNMVLDCKTGTEVSAGNGTATNTATNDSAE